MKTLNKPKLVTSFIEDDFEVIKKDLIQSARNEARLEEEIKRKKQIILAVRILISIIAAGLALVLYILLDDFIAHYFMNTAFLLIR